MPAARTDFGRFLARWHETERRGDDDHAPVLAHPREHLAAERLGACRIQNRICGDGDENVDRRAFVALFRLNNGPVPFERSHDLINEGPCRSDDEGFFAADLHLYRHRASPWCHKLFVDLAH